MNAKSFLIGVATTLVCVAIGVAICCGICKKCNRPLPPVPPCTMEQCPRPERTGFPERGGKCNILKCADELQLSAEQISQIKELQKAKHKAIKAEKRKFDEGVRNILTDEQKSKLETMKKTPRCKKNKRCPDSSNIPVIEIDL